MFAKLVLAWILKNVLLSPLYVIIFSSELNIYFSSLKKYVRISLVKPAL